LWSVLVLSSFVLWVSGFDSSNAPCAGFLFNGPSSCWRIDLLDGSVGCESCELIVILSVAAWSFVIVWGLMVCAQECRSAVPIRCQSVYERAFINAAVSQCMRGPSSMLLSWGCAAQLCRSICSTMLVTSDVCETVCSCDAVRPWGA
jgi:hypothetical protein